MASTRPIMIPPAAAPAFLADHGWEGADILPLAGDASFRRYFRVVAGDRRAVLMDAPPEHEDVRPFLAVAAELDRRGLSAPQPYAVDEARGLLLLEDFGDLLVGPVLRSDPLADEETIYSRAIDVLDAIGERPAPDHIAPYDEAVMLREAMLFPEWYGPAVDLELNGDSFADAWRESWVGVLEAAANARTLVLRDYHADNLMLLDRPGVRGLGLLDFQDALAGHPAYDLVSLLQDARRDVPEALEGRMLERWLAGKPRAEAETFIAHYQLLGAQRNTKILGIFTRLWKRDGKTGYLPLQPRVWNYLERNLAHSALAPIRAWFDAHVPADRRAPAWRKGVPA